ncbi:MAG: hypothetical protein Q7J42_14070 [Sulfuritalea sp.]|nr:hypothetical protein [Sulfuritalea sp.]
MSNKIALLPGEHVVMSSDNDILILTNKRVRYDSVVWGQSNLIGITLSSVASCGLVTKSFPFLLIFAVFALLVAFNQSGGPQWGLLLAAAVLVVAYFVTRKAVISVASKGGQEILVPTKGMNREAILGFIEAVEREKLK